MGDKQEAFNAEQEVYDVALREKMDTQKFTAALDKMK